MRLPTAEGEHLHHNGTQKSRRGIQLVCSMVTNAHCSAADPALAQPLLSRVLAVNSLTSSLHVLLICRIRAGEYIQT